MCETKLLGTQGEKLNFSKEINVRVYKRMYTVKSTK